MYAQTILFGEQVIGNISHHNWFGEPEVTYWIGKSFWGQGLATKALGQFLEQASIRPLHARFAEDKLGSKRVLEKCGFEPSGKDKGFAEARGYEVEELIFILR